MRFLGARCVSIKIRKRIRFRVYYNLNRVLYAVICLEFGQEVSWRDFAAVATSLVIDLYVIIIKSKMDVN